jgi:hypothetical protein
LDSNCVIWTSCAETLAIKSASFSARELEGFENDCPNTQQVEKKHIPNTNFISDLIINIQRLDTYLFFFLKREGRSPDKKKRRAADWREPPGAGVVDGKESY